MPGARSKLLVGRTIGASAYPQKKITTNLSTPKDGGRFILARLANRSHNVNVINLLIICSAFLWKKKPGGVC